MKLPKHYHLLLHQELLLQVSLNYYEFVIIIINYLKLIYLTIIDEANDRRSLSRKLPDSLYLIVKRNRKDNPWQFPQGKWIEGESLRKVKLQL